MRQERLGWNPWNRVYDVGLLWGSGSSGQVAPPPNHPAVGREKGLKMRCLIFMSQLKIVIFDVAESIFQHLLESLDSYHFQMASSI